MEEQVRRIAAEYLHGVKPTGEDDLRANCPLCGRRRTFVINLQQGMWWCFGCREGGGLLQVLYHFGLSRRQIDRVRRKLDLRPPMSPRLRKKVEIAKREKAAETSVLPEYILGVYDRCPLQLVKAGFDDETLQRHDVGFDRVNNRITFPVRDHLGRLVAISGRASDDGTFPRYKVYEATPPVGTKPAGELYGVVENYIPRNREYLYCFNDVYPLRFFNPKETTPLIVVEGYKGCLWLRQLGFAHTVALQGSSMTPGQRRQLNKLRGPYYIFLDHEPGKAFPDDSGHCEAAKIAERLSSAGKVFLCMYPGYTDEDPFTSKKQGTSPDDLNKEEINQVVESAKTLSQLIARTENNWRRS